MRFTTANASWFNPYWEGEGAAGGAGGETPPAGGEGATWYEKSGVAADHHEWLRGKQFADVNLLLASHRSLEGLVGRQRLAVPNGPEDKEAWEAIYRTSGRPDKPEGYKLKDGSKINGDEFKAFQPIFHEAGVSQAQAERILEAYEKRAGEQFAAADVERANAEKLQVEKLDKEWGSQAEANKDVASRAFRQLGMDEAMSDKIEAAIGYEATMKLFHAIGSGMKEPAFHQDGAKGGSHNMGGTLEGERNKLQTLFKDEPFMKRYMNGDPRIRKSAIEEVEAIQKRISDLTTGNG